MIELKENLCLSGGAIGADTVFGQTALENDHGLIHWSFGNHKVKSQKENVVVLPKEELIKADEYLLIVKLFVERSFPCSSDFVNNLLRRSYFQVRDSASCYAISEIKDGLVQGGTAWGVALFLLKHNFEPCMCYVFCQTQKTWFKWEKAWKEIIIPPKPIGIYAGIGSRKLMQCGEDAIWNIYNQSTLPVE